MYRLKITDFDLKIDKISTLNSMGFYNSNLNYSDISDTYDCLLNDLFKISNAVGIIAVDNHKLNFDCFRVCDTTIYVIYTLGIEICNYIDLKLKKSYLEYIMSNSIADRLLFSMEYKLNEAIKRYCIENDLGVIIRAEPSNDIDIYAQKIIWEETLADKLGIHINDKFVLSPVKTNTFILGAKSQSKSLNLEHSCSSCKSVNCSIKDENKNRR